MVLSEIASALIPQTLTGFLAAVVVILSLWWYLQRPKNFPPGPWGIPVFGYLLSMQDDLNESFQQLGKKYGPLIGLYIGLERTVVINDFKLLKKAFVELGDVFSGRPDSVASIFLDKKKSMSGAEGRHWRTLRRFGLAALRDYGMGKSIMERKILDEITYFLKELEVTKSKEFAMEPLLTAMIGNVLSILEFNRRFDYDDPKLQKLKEQSEEASCNIGGLAVATLHMFPRVLDSDFLSKLTGLQKLKESTEFQNKFIKDIVDDHYKNFNPANCEDYTDALLAEREERKKKNQHPDIFDDETIIHELRVLYSAGTDTTAMVMRWILVYLIAHPDAQRKVQREIDDVIGQNRTPGMDDRKNMPYTEAFLMEVMRKRPTTFLIDAHKTLEDVRLGGYFIPKGTAVYGNSFAIHNDRELWGDPNSFRPERFINEDGQLCKPEYLIPFSVGKRNCIGESLARMLLFLSVTSLLQKYTLFPPEGQQIDTVGCSGFSHVDLCDKMRAVSREDTLAKTISSGM